jgi:hypothetical protein
MKFNFLRFIFLALLLNATACTSPYQKFYTQRSPNKFTKSNNPIIFGWANIDLTKYYENHFSDYLIIGISAFEGPLQDEKRAISQGKSVGADIVLTNYSYKSSNTSNIPITLPKTQTSFHTGTINSFSNYGTSTHSFTGNTTTMGTQTFSVPVTTDIYDQQAFYLKNIKNVKSQWSYTIRDFDTAQKGYRTISDEGYVIHDYELGDEVVAFVAQTKDSKVDFKPGELKYRYNKKSGKGIYLHGNKSPISATFATNRFGHLEIVTDSGIIYNFNTSQ